jgi:hypothetical protein
VIVLWLIAVASIAPSIPMLAAGGQIARQEERQDGSDETIWLVDLVYEEQPRSCSTRGFLAREQARLIIGTMDDDAIAAAQLELHSRPGELSCMTRSPR